VVPVTGRYQRPRAGPAGPDQSPRPVTASRALSATAAIDPAALSAPGFPGRGLAGALYRRRAWRRPDARAPGAAGGRGGGPPCGPCPARK